MKKWIWAVIFLAIAIILIVVLPSGRWTLKPASTPSTSPSSLTTDTSFDYDALGLHFQSLVELPKQADIGANPDVAASFGIPGEDGRLTFNLILAKISPEEKNDAKTIYAGTSAPATEKVMRSFFGKPVEGGKQTTKIPKPSTLESYLMTLPNGQQLFLAIKYSGSVTDEQANKILGSIAKTLKQR